MKKIYKYLASEYYDKVFLNKAFFNLKASRPKDFNDPYELFLTIETDGVRREVLAYYQEILGKVPQWPTICFSARPDVIPMWAHYGRDFSGIVIECDEQNIKKAFPDSRIEKVTYSKTPIAINVHQVTHAHDTCKPRHTFLLQRAATDAAYFTKSKYWSYELEKRFIVDDKFVAVRDGAMTVQFPVNCVTAIIVGPKTNPKTADILSKFCKKTGCAFYTMHIGRSSLRPFFTNAENESFIFNGKKIAEVENPCATCKEPVEDDQRENCHWCDVTEADKANAAFRNPMRQLAQMGLLEDYLKRVSNIE